MVTSAEVFKQIKEMERKTLHEHRRILLSEMAEALSVSQNDLLVLLVELENRGLVKIHKIPIASVSLTDYGMREEEASGGLRS